MNKYIKENLAGDATRVVGRDIESGIRRIGSDMYGGAKKATKAVFGGIAKKISGKSQEWKRREDRRNFLNQIEDLKKAGDKQSLGIARAALKK